MTILAVCYVAMNGIMGTFRFEQMASTTPLKVNYEVSGLPPGNHGFHIHQFGDTGNKCMNAGAHYNPLQQPHGGPFDQHRHMGDLGNLFAGPDGSARGSLVTVVQGGPSLFTNTVIGRALVIHANQDDLGRGNNAESKITGNSGGRLACCSIALAKS